MKKQSGPAFKAGDKVLMTPGYRGQTVFEVEGKPTWNGLTWMYSFVGTDISCGEIYLSRLVAEV